MNTRIVAELDALQTEVDALKRLQAETPVNGNTGQAAADPPAFHFGATRLDAFSAARGRGISHGSWRFVVEIWK